MIAAINELNTAALQKAEFVDVTDDDDVDMLDIVQVFYSSLSRNCKLCHFLPS